jgi:hypothetical protein
VAVAVAPAVGMMPLNGPGRSKLSAPVRRGIGIADETDTELAKSTVAVVPLATDSPLPRNAELPLRVTDTAAEPVSVRRAAPDVTTLFRVNETDFAEELPIVMVPVYCTVVVAAAIVMNAPVAVPPVLTTVMPNEYDTASVIDTNKVGALSPTTTEPAQSDVPASISVLVPVPDSGSDPAFDPLPERLSCSHAAQHSTAQRSTDGISA